MCEANAYLLKPGGENLMVMENVYRVKPEQGKLYVKIKLMVLLQLV
jgi:hypothetical protein